MQKRRRSELLLITTAVLGLHILLVWMLIAHSRISTPATKVAALELMFIPLIAKLTPPKPPITQATPRTARKTPGMRGTPPVAVPHSAIETAIPPPMDWHGELDRAARDAIVRQSAPRARSFGFPEPKLQPPPKVEEFAWDYVATHRVESIPEGGIVVHLNEHCVLVLFPLPFMGCGIGKKKPNGQLFENMRDPKSPSGAGPRPLNRIGNALLSQTFIGCFIIGSDSVKRCTQSPILST